MASWDQPSPTSMTLADVAPVSYIQEEADFSLYYYVPVLSAAIIFVVLFGFATAVHVVQTIYHREWWAIILPIGTALEVVGYAM